MKIEQVSHYHGPGETLKAFLGSGTARQVRVETSHRIRRGYGGSWRPRSAERGRTTCGWEGGSGKKATTSGAELDSVQGEVKGTAWI